MNSDTFLTGSCYTGVVGPEHDIGVCRDSIHNITRRPGDTPPAFIRATKGYEAREMHIARFLESDHAFLLLLDHDMIFPPDTLERLRRHGRPYVSGYYLRRRYAPIASVWFDPFEGVWPMKPFTDDPAPGQLHELGASGWGCVLIHRSVFEGVRPLLKGEGFVLEDDMDVWPYDLERVIKAVSALHKATDDIDSEWDESTRNYIRYKATKLHKELRPLRATKDIVGSDIRFPFFAKQAGFTLWGDPDVRCGHVLNYPLSPDDYSGMDANVRQQTAADIEASVQKARTEWSKITKRGNRVERVGIPILDWDDNPSDVTAQGAAVEPEAHGWTNPPAVCPECGGSKFVDVYKGKRCHACGRKVGTEGES
jgi:hypothetical protein